MPVRRNGGAAAVLFCFDAAAFNALSVAAAVF
jgi:hypothetical protein